MRLVYRHFLLKRGKGRYRIFSMKNMNEVTKKIAFLSRLKLSDQETEQYAGELEKILAFVAELGEVNTDGVEPVVHGIPLDPHFREDESIMLSEEETKRILQCSEQSIYEQYRVPQVLGGEG
jgi:aspartyl-tRNA(Asn)/glutamyl-tRNA(Gln) amidotransferase subunit C